LLLALFQVAVEQSAAVLCIGLADAVGQVAGEDGPVFVRKVAVGDAVGDQNEEEQELGKEIEILRADLDRKIGLARVLQRIVGDARDGEGQRVRDLQRSTGAAFLEPTALDADSDGISPVKANRPADYADSTDYPKGSRRCVCILCDA
jgi:hypothetical protein